MDTRAAISRGRAFVEHEKGLTCSLLALLEDVIILPVLKDLLLQLGKANSAVDLFEHRRVRLLDG
jgi:hypothetical protein